MSKEKKSSGFAKILLISVASLGIGAGGFWFYDNNIANASAQNTVEARVETTPSSRQMIAVPEPIFYDLEPFTITLPDGRTSRILYVGLTLQLQDEASKERFDRYLPVVRSRIITELSDLPAPLLSERETKDMIRATIANTLTAPFGSEHQKQHITDVLFSAYVVQ